MILPDNHPYTQICKRVVSRLGPATGKTDINWRVYVIDQPIPNAFVIPGGQIFVFTVVYLLFVYVDLVGQGILPIAQNDSGLATILGHEIAHYTLRHIAEKTSTQEFFKIVGVTTFWILGLPIDWYFQIQHLGLELPNSRACETEGPFRSKLLTDFSRLCRIALYGKGFYFARYYLTRQACYDPREGPKVWQRMAEMAKGQPHIPAFLSTHPENHDREQRMESYVQEVSFSDHWNLICRHLRRPLRLGVWSIATLGIHSGWQLAVCSAHRFGELLHLSTDIRTD